MTVLGLKTYTVMSSLSENNKRIAKNTLVLYARMLLMMCIGLFTSRVILNTLGVEDFGIYNVVGGVVMLFTFLNGALASATSRHITYEIGKGGGRALKTIFGVSLSVHGVLGLLVVLLSETIGLWFFYQKMQIPSGRITAAIWVYQLSVVSTVVSIMMIPYNAVVIAYERMSAFAWMSLLDAVLKLLIVYLLVVIPADKLIAYALLFFVVSLIDQLIYIIYCWCHFPEVRVGFLWERSLSREFSSFAFWSLFGNMAGMAYTQGLNLLLNVFFGPVVNAARGIAVQVQGIVQRFINNFQMALNPQITKSYAVGDLPSMHALMFRSARFSYFLMFLLSLPLLLETDFILKVWLKQVPDDTATFCRIILCTSLIYTLANPMVVANQATAQVKRYQLVCGGILLTILPFSYVALKLGAPAYSVFLIHFFVELVCQYARMYMLRDLIHLPVSAYVRHIYRPVFIVSAVSIVVPLAVYAVLPVGGLVRFLAVGFLSVVSVAVVVYTMGLSDRERAFVREMMAKRVGLLMQKK